MTTTDHTSFLLPKYVVTSTWNRPHILVLVIERASSRYHSAGCRGSSWAVEAAGRCILSICISLTVTLGLGWAWWSAYCRRQRESWHWLVGSCYCYCYCYCYESLISKGGEGGEGRSTARIRISISRILEWCRNRKNVRRISLEL